MYPIANCKKNQFPLYAMPGILIKVRTEVSVATMDNMATTQGRFLLPKKKSDIVLFLRLWIQPYAIIEAKNKTINKLSNQCITYLLIYTYFIKIIGRELLFWFEIMVYMYIPEETSFPFWFNPFHLTLCWPGW